MHTSANTRIESIVVTTMFHCPSLQRRREEFKRHIREQEEELIQQANELEEKELRQTEEEEEDEKRRREMDEMELFNYTSSTYPNSSDMNFDLYRGAIPPKDQDADMHHLNHPESDSSVGMLSPVPGSTSWESNLAEIELVKGNEGLGFSLLDFAVCQNAHFIYIRNMHMYSF